MVLLRQLFDSAGGGGAETDTFKHLAASFAVLRSLGAAKTTANRESSRIVSFDLFFVLPFPISCLVLSLLATSSFDFWTL